MCCIDTTYVTAVGVMCVVSAKDDVLCGWCVCVRYVCCNCVCVVMYVCCVVCVCAKMCASVNGVRCLLSVW